MTITRLVPVLVLALLGACSGRSSPPPPAGDERATFEGTWSVTGKRRTLPTGAGSDAAVVDLQGPLGIVRGGDGLARGFQGELIGFDNGGAVIVGRAVFRDDAGDAIFVELRGEPLQPGKRMEGTVTGGSGRYAGLSGEFSLQWQYAVAADDTVQARTEVFTGRFSNDAAAR